MIRDWDLYRDILLYVERDASPQKPWLEIDIEGKDAETIASHVKMLGDDGLITLKDLSNTSNLNAIYPINLTGNGRFMAEKLRDDSFWNTVKSKMRDYGKILTVEAFKSLVNTLSQS